MPVLPPGMPSTAHVTFWLLKPVMLALNCCVPLIAIAALAGVTVTVGSMTFKVVLPVRYPPQMA